MTTNFRAIYLISSNLAKADITYYHSNMILDIGESVIVDKICYKVEDIIYDADRGIDKREVRA